MEFTTKGVYHSKLAAASPIRICFTGPIMESKYGKGDFVGIRLDGDEMEHTYTVESDLVRATIEALPKNEWVTARFMGSREAAVLEIDGQAFDGDPGEDWEPAPAKPVAKAAPRPAAAHQAPPPPKTVPLVPLMRQCIDAAVELLDGQELTEAERAIALSLFIELRRNGGATL